MKAEPGYGDIAIGGATLAAEATALDLIDEYRVEVAMEHCRVEIQAVGPGDRPALGVYPHLGEVLRVVEWRKDGSTV